MCNLYSITKGQQAIRDLAKAMRDNAGNMPSLPGVFPDSSAPIVRTTPDGVRELTMTRSASKAAASSPFTSFSENEALADGSRPPVWFALDDSRPLAFFAGIWTRWTSVRKVKEGETTNDLFAFLTTEPNAIVEPIHDKAMPVILTKPDELEAWLTAPTVDALELQRPLPDDALRIVARGEKRDGA